MEWREVYARGPVLGS